MIFVDNNSSFVTGSFYPSVAEAVAFHVPATQLSESYTRMRVDCLNRSPSIAEVDGFYCYHRLNCNHLGAVHNGAGIPGFLAQLMVGNMYRICCFNVCGVVAFCFAANGITERR
jgi:hypothetical protein